MWREEQLIYDLPLLLARIGERQRALSLVESNLAEFPDEPNMLLPAGQALETLGENDRTTGPNPRIAMPSPGWASKPVCVTRSLRHTSRSSSGKAEATPPKGSGNPRGGRGARSKKRERAPLAC